MSSAAYGTPQRSSTGFDTKRLNMLLAVLEKRCGFKLGAKDVFINDLKKKVNKSYILNFSNNRLNIFSFFKTEINRINTYIFISTYIYGCIKSFIQGLQD